MLKWLNFVLLLIIAIWAAWYFGIAQSIGGAFDLWLKWIGAR